MWASLKYGVVSAFIASIFVAAVAAQNTYATDFDWTTKNASVEFADDNSLALNTVANSTQPCLQQEVSTFNTAKQDFESTNACVHFSGSVRLARITKCVTVFGNFCIDRSWEAASFGGDSHMYRVENLPEGTGDNCWQTTTSSSRLVYSCNSNTYVVENIYQYITRKVSSVGEVYYEFDVSGAKPYLDTAGNPVRMYALEVSRSGRWAVAEVMNVGLVRIDLGDGSMKLFTKDVRWYGYGSDPTYHFSITDDGKYIAVAGMNVGANIYRLSDSCGDDAPAFKAEWKQANVSVKECPYKDLVPELIEANGGSVAGFGYLSKIAFNDDAGQLVGYYQPYRYVNNAKAGWVTITAEGYVPAPRLDYLALGDSYSSGEGDFNIFGSHSNFMPFTDTKGPPQERCHLSKNSYPYLLRDMYGIQSTKMKSVACSGAKTTDVVYDNSEYHGQDNRLLHVNEGRDYQADALNYSFIPGRVAQIEFVKRYKPRVITIGIGGNDVGFADVLTKCVDWPGSVCDEVDGENNARERMGKIILANYTKLRKLYRQLHNASPESLIYAVGYPQFINKVSSACELNGAFVNGEERIFMNEAVSFMNSVIKSAATAEGVQYLDIENSLKGGRLCEGISKDYVTGARDQGWIPSLLSDEMRVFLYHPNAAGHKRIAKTIYNQIGNNLYSSSAPSSQGQSPPYSNYFASADDYHVQVKDKDFIVHTVHTRGDAITANFDEGEFGSSEITVSIYSTPRVLGIVSPNSDGGLSHSFIIPSDLELGYHTVVVEGSSYSGEPVEYAQTIFVIGENPKDIDDDNIVDVRDSCLFEIWCRTMQNHADIEAEDNNRRSRDFEGNQDSDSRIVKSSSTKEVKEVDVRYDHAKDTKSRNVLGDKDTARVDNNLHNVLWSVLGLIVVLWLIVKGVKYVKNKPT